MLSRLAASLLAAALGSAPLTSAWADELVIPVGHQGADKASLPRPVAGQTAAAVEQKFGAPLNKSAAVGNPPISQWEYPEYRVFFEGDRVLHSVLKPVPVDSGAPEAAPAPLVAEPVSESPAAVPATAAPEASPPAAETPAAP